jgi:hypothetical protein
MDLPASLERRMFRAEDGFFRTSLHDTYHSPDECTIGGEGVSQVHDLDRWNDIV